MYFLLYPLISGCPLFALELQPFQQAWQASVPIPVNVHFDVPFYAPSSLLQLESPVIGNLASIRLHGPEESPAIMDEEVDAVKFQETTTAEFARQAENAQRRLLLETIDRSVERLVHELTAPLQALPNPLG